jgi:large subunit ribosomal protein L15
MELSRLPKITQKNRKRIGRGHGSGRGGHTSTRGSKGQKSRSHINLFFEGTKVKKSYIKRLPLFRGKGKFTPVSIDPVIVNIKYLNLFKAGEEVSLLSLQANGILSKKLSADTKVKILGDGELDKALTVTVLTSNGARQKIEKAGGKVEVTRPLARQESEKLETKEPEKVKTETVKKKTVTKTTVKAKKDKK